MVVVANFFFRFTLKYMIETPRETEIIDEKYVIDHRLAHYRDLEAQINDAMTAAVTGHDNKNDGFSPLKYNAEEPEKYLSQRADCVALLGQAATIKTFRELAPAIYPAFDESVDRFLSERGDLVTHAADVLQNGKDLHVITDHRDVIGVAVDSAIVAAALYESGHVDHGDIETQIAVSTMLKNTAIFGAPAADILSGVFSMTYFVVPSGNQDNKKKLPENYSEDFNEASLAARHIDREKPAVVAVAPSGTRDVHIKSLLHRDRNGYHMGPPSDGTVQEYMTEIHMLTMGHDLSKGVDGMFIGRMWLPSPLQSVSKLAIMTSIADGMTEQTGIPSHYVPKWNEFQQLKKASKQHD